MSLFSQVSSNIFVNDLYKIDCKIGCNPEKKSPFQNCYLGIKSINHTFTSTGVTFQRPTVRIPASTSHPTLHVQWRQHRRPLQRRLVSWSPVAPSPAPWLPSFTEVRLSWTFSAWILPSNLVTEEVTQCVAMTQLPTRIRKSINIHNTYQNP